MGCFHSKPFRNERPRSIPKVAKYEGVRGLRTVVGGVQLVLTHELMLIEYHVLVQDIHIHITGRSWGCDASQTAQTCSQRTQLQQLRG